MTATLLAAALVALVFVAWQLAELRETVADVDLALDVLIDQHRPTYLETWGPVEDLAEAADDALLLSWRDKDGPA